MTKKLIILAVGLCLLFATMIPAGYPVSAQGQDQIVVSSSTVQANYPDSLTFSCHVQDSNNITDIRLEYQVEQMSFAQITSEAEVTFDPSTFVNASYKLNMEEYGQIPPGVDIEYWWKVKDAAGDSLQTAPINYTVYDNNRTWNTLTQGKINVYWYGQNQAFGQAVMTEAQNALSTITSVTGGTLNQTVNISVFTSAQDYQSSVLGVPEWSGGEEVSQYNAIYVIVEPNELSSALPAVAHELTHVVEDQMSFNPYNSLPVWLNEGLAVYIQFYNAVLPSQFTSALSSAIAHNTLISVRSLSDPFSAYPDQADLSYAESVSVVTYLIDQYGSTKINQLLDTFQQGSNYDGALETVYGFNMDGLFTQWKAWVITHNGSQPIY
ncbi:MAG TPA: peptidase MA family metallohydrolase [Dehalococcoidia bacterium]|nr:peptidase MA family metallohydrolase [Dehalococcoidia bacterium]